MPLWIISKNFLITQPQKHSFKNFWVEWLYQKVILSINNQRLMIFLSMAGQLVFL